MALTKEKSKKLFITVFTVIVVIFLGFRLNSASRNVKYFILTLTPMFYHPVASYDEKMSSKYPVFYDYLNIIKSLIPENSNVYINDTGDVYTTAMGPISNLQVSSALLYPRNVKLFETGDVPNLESGDYVVMASGFPKSKIKSAEIYLVVGKNVKVTKGNYNPANFDPRDIGLIKI